MKNLIVKLADFEGPIELAWALIQKNEINISDISLKELIEQIQSALVDKNCHLDLAAESIGHAGNLLWIKSRSLLPKTHVENDEDPSVLQVALLEKLVEYCRFKDAAARLSLKEEKTKESFFRPFSISVDTKKSLGLDHVSLFELSSIFQTVIEKAIDIKGVIEEEEWTVGDKMKMLKKALTESGRIPLEDFFTIPYNKLEIIVFFLAILELMKLGELRIIKEPTTRKIELIPHEKRN